MIRAAYLASTAGLTPTEYLARVSAAGPLGLVVTDTARIEVLSALDRLRPRPALWVRIDPQFLLAESETWRASIQTDVISRIWQWGWGEIHAGREVRALVNGEPVFVYGSGWVLDWSRPELAEVADSIVQAVWPRVAGLVDGAMIEVGGGNLGYLHPDLRDRFWPGWDRLLLRWRGLPGLHPPLGLNSLCEAIHGPGLRSFTSLMKLEAAGTQLPSRTWEAWREGIPDERAGVRSCRASVLTAVEDWRFWLAVALLFDGERLPSGDLRRVYFSPSFGTESDTWSQVPDFGARLPEFLDWPEWSPGGALMYRDGLWCRWMKKWPWSKLLVLNPTERPIRGVAPGVARMCGPTEWPRVLLG